MNTEQVVAERQQHNKCSIGVYCSEHSFIPMNEAEELRDKLEVAIDGDHRNIKEFRDALRTLLEQVDARDSCAYLSANRAANAEDIRAQGWSVAVHNDYKIDGVSHTFWLFTKNGQAIKGEGRTDADALYEVRKLISKGPINVSQT
jgi:hypothetical protein